MNIPLDFVSGIIHQYSLRLRRIIVKYLAIIPQARMAYESIAHEAEGRMGYWLRGHEGESNNCFSKIQLVGQLVKKVSRRNIFRKLKLDFNPLLPPKHFKYGRRFSLLVGYNIYILVG